MTVREVVVEEADQLGQLLGEVVGALVQPVGAAQGGGGGAVGAGGAAEAEVDAARRQCLQGAELFGDDERGVVGQHHAAGAQAYPLGVGGEVGEDHRRGGGGDTGHGVVFGDPVTGEAPAVGGPGDPDRRVQGVRGRLAGADGGQVQYGEGVGAVPWTFPRMSSTGVPPVAGGANPCVTGG